MDIKNYLMQFYIEQNGETLSPELAAAIVEKLEVTDGSDRATGEKWTIQEAQEIGEKCGVDFSAVLIPEYYAVLNMLYSKYYKVFKKRGISDPLLYAEMAQAWFLVADRQQNYTFNYFLNC